MGVSVIICCFNSGWIIRRTLDALARQCTDKFGECWEIILVDNNSTDDTKCQFEQFQHENPLLDCHLVHENRQGLSIARVSGYLVAKYSTIIYCDDDTLLCCDYLATAFSLMRENPRLGLCGGLGNPIFESTPDPRTLPFLDRYATGPQGSSDFCDITSRGFVYGAGMVIRKKALDELFALGFEFSTPGRKGALLTGGEDVELGHAITALGYQCFYCAALAYDHLLPSRRLTWAYLKRMAFGNGFTSVYSPNFQTLFTFKSNPFYVVLWIMGQTAKQVLLLIMGFSRDKNILNMQRLLGAAYGIFTEFPYLFRNRRKTQFFYSKLRKTITF
jgi:glycosyltransferase involved in cell wall biosynthesis